jgi:hypothetical protein
VQVLPWVDADPWWTDPQEVELRTPDGTVRRVRAAKMVPLGQKPWLGDGRVQARLDLLGVTAADIPLGTEVWTVD